MCSVRPGPPGPRVESLGIFPLGPLQMVAPRRPTGCHRKASGRPENESRGHARAALRLKKCPGGDPGQGSRPSFYGQSCSCQEGKCPDGAIARKAEPNGTDQLVVPPLYRFVHRLARRSLCRYRAPSNATKVLAGFQGPDHENALERWSPRARYNCLRESRVRHGSGRNQLHLYLAHARRNTEATTRNGASSSAATPRRQTPKTTPPRPRRKGSGSSPSARVATTSGQLGKTNSGAALGARNSLRDWSVGQFNRSRCPGPSGGSKVKPAWPPRLLPDLPTGDVELIEHLLRHYVLVDIGDLLAQAADQL